MKPYDTISITLLYSMHCQLLAVQYYVLVVIDSSLRCHIQSLLNCIMREKEREWVKWYDRLRERERENG
jgi:hypothetical protein